MPSRKFFQSGSSDCLIETGYICSGEPSFCSEISGEVIFVDGNLSGDCVGSYSIVYRNCSGSDGDAYDTPQEAADVVEAGDVVYLRGGVYYIVERLEIINKFGTGSSAKITITNYNSEEVILDASGGPTSSSSAAVRIYAADYVVLSGMTILDSRTYSLRVDSSDYIEVTDMNITGGIYYGIYLYYGDNVIIDGCSITNKAGGIRNLLSDYMTVQNCIIVASTSKGILVTGSSDCTIDRNDISGGDAGIIMSEGTSLAIIQRNIVSNNICHDNLYDPEGADGIALAIGTFDSFVIDNICYGNADDGIDASTNTGGEPGFKSNERNTITGNIVFSNGVGEEGDGNGIKVSTNAGGGHTVGNNVVFDNNRAGFDQDKALGYPQNFFYNNIAYGNGLDDTSNMYSGFVMDARSLPEYEDAVLYNNIAANNAKWDVFGTAGNLSFDISDYNFWGDSNFVDGMDVHSLGGNPGFNNPSLVIDTNFGVGWSIDEKLEYIRNQVSEKFSLQAGSQAIDNGTVIDGYHCASAGETGDCVTWYGDAPDIGAYESDT